MKYSLSPFGIDMFLYAVEHSILKQRDRYNYPFSTYAAIAPLRRHIATGRASAAWLQSLLSIRPDVIARRLLQGGSDDDAIARVRALVESRMITEGGTAK